MFLGFFEENEKKAFLGLAHKMAMADGIMHENEDTMMRLYEKECGISLGDEKDGDVATLCSAFISKQNRLYCLIELLTIALSDDKYHEGEQNLIGRISAQFNIDDTTTHYLKHWIIRQNAMISEISEFVDKE